MNISEDKKGWLPCFDGMCALAISLVLIHHFNNVSVGKWAMGNTGVMLFFGISGFLVFYVIERRYQETGTFSYADFMLRRVLRIWPLYYVFILLVLSINYFSGTTIDLDAYIPALTFSLNLEMGAYGVWAPSGLSQFWSIAVEEHFYVLAPLFFFLIRSRYSMWVAIGVLAISNAIRAYYLSSFDPMLSGNGGLYYQSYAYADTLVAGGVACRHYLARETYNVHLKRFLSSGAGLLVSVLLLLVIARTWGLAGFPPYKSYAYLPYLLGPAAVYIFILSVLFTESRAIRMLFENAAVRIVGTLSYALYVSHLYLFQNFDHFLPEDVRGDEPDFITNLYAFSILLIFAMALHFSVERPFLRLKNRKQTSPYITTNGTPIPWAVSLTFCVLVSGGARYLIAN